MNVVGVTMVKDEADIVIPTLSHMMTQVDALIVADNMSTDGTLEIVQSLAADVPKRILVVEDHEVGYTQSAKMTRLAHMANRVFGASWIIPFDADEIWMYLAHNALKEALEQVHPSKMVVKAALFDYVATARDDPKEANPVYRLQWRRRMAAPLPKVACRYHETMKIGMGNHDVTYNGYLAEGDTMFTISHFPYRSPEQVIRKIRNGSRAYAATNLPSMYGDHWRGWGRILDEQGEDAIVDLFHKWHWREAPDQPLTVDGEEQPSLLHIPLKQRTHQL